MSNEQREDNAAEAINAYVLAKRGSVAYTEEPLQDKVSDLLADLLHFASANRQPLDLEKAMRVAQMNFQAEQDEAK
ncbi:hypothetical protein [Hymenobacter siberiensis]|uniref:hypothetical protein n=1 Tax=Hymenobacter siberiensis TaxID=2848396 RepID=UPI001C1DF126|nr:hypothetical protein [Hymenobacter siberiensis]